MQRAPGRSSQEPQPVETIRAMAIFLLDKNSMFETQESKRLMATIKRKGCASEPALRKKRRKGAEWRKKSRAKKQEKKSDNSSNSEAEGESSGSNDESSDSSHAKSLLDSDREPMSWLEMEDKKEPQRKKKETRTLSKGRMWELLRNLSYTRAAIERED